MKSSTKISIVSVIVLILLISVIALGMWGCPKYKKYEKNLSGQAALAEAEWTKRIRVEEAKAEIDAAVQFAKADSVRAIGIANANMIISNSITKEYIQYKFIEGLNDGNTEVIYVPTEANIPVMESYRLMKNQSNK